MVVQDFTNEYHSAARALFPDDFREMIYHGDVLPGSRRVVVTEEPKRAFLGFGYLIAAESYAYREKVGENGQFEVQIVFKTDLSTEKGVEAAEMLLTELLRTCRELSEKDPAHPITARMWVDRREEAYGAFLEDFGFRETDRMWVMERALTEGAEPEPITNLTAELENEAVMADYIAATEEGYGFPDSEEEMKYRLHYGNGRVYTLENKSYVTTWKISEGVAATENVFTRKAYRRQGYCTRTLNAVAAILAGEGMRKARLNVYEWNKEAIALYEKCGYVHTRTLREMTLTTK